MEGGKRTPRWWVPRAREDAPRSCDWPGCAGTGLYRAPLSRDDLSRYHWFCLGHVREYNAAWNYYAGMSDAEVEADVRKDTVWRRPSWRLGSRGGHDTFDPSAARDPFGLFGGSGHDRGDRGCPTPRERAMIVLDLRPPLTTASVKARYKKLVKRHHPDANGGDKASEEKFKQIHQAYQTIMDSLPPHG